MTCGGCSGAVERNLKKLEGETCSPLHDHDTATGVTGIEIDMEGQKVIVESTESQEVLLAQIQKTGKVGAIVVGLQRHIAHLS